MVDHPDFVLIHRAQRGDQRAFGRLVERHQQRVYALLYGMLSNPHDTQDAVQETFVAAYRGLANFRSDAEFTTWIHRIALNKAHDLLRKRIPVPHDPQSELAMVIDEAAISAQSQFQQSDTRSIVQAGIAELDPNFREALLLVDVLDVSIVEAAEILDVAVGTVKSRVFRARREMAQYLRAAGIEPAVSVDVERTTGVAGTVQGTSGTIPHPPPSDNYGSDSAERTAE